jgi:hypothetical protein
MTKKILLLFIFLTSSVAQAATSQQMNQAFEALSKLVPYLTSEEKFQEKKNTPLIEENLIKIQQAFKSAGHESLLKQDIFLPSYKLIQENLSESLQSFKKGNKEISLWRLKELTAICLDCHTRLPGELPSSYELTGLDVDHSRFTDAYNLGIAQLIVRRYVDAKNSFTRSIDQKILKGDMNDLIDPFKQILLLETKVHKNPKAMITLIDHYKDKKGLSLELKQTLHNWREQLLVWTKKNMSSEGLKTDEEVQNFIRLTVEPLTKHAQLEDVHDVDHLFISGYLSNYMFRNKQSNLGPDLNFWIGRSEKYLKRENFFGSGDLFFKQCILRYPKHAMALKCFEEYKDSIEFEFSGSSGTHIPQEIKKELNELKGLINKK